jgi:hypothetical protein
VLYDGAHTVHTPPPVGALVALDHAVWRVITVDPLPEDKWSDDDRRRVGWAKPGYQATVLPMAVVLRPVGIVGDDPRDRDRDRHEKHGGWRTWSVYPDGHYPVCRACGEPTPCRERLNQRAAVKVMADMARYETPGVCPHCQEAVTARQKQVTYEGGVEVPGPPVTFHVGRAACCRAAVTYEARWMAADPENRHPMARAARLVPA